MEKNRMKKIAFVSICLLLICHLQSFAQTEFSFVKTTYPFSVKDGQTLSLDLYTSGQMVSEPAPCIIFMFGGAFARGTRDVPKYMPYFDYLVQHGYTVVSIDYRLGLKDAAQQPGLTEEQFAGYFIHAVDIAVEDLFDATRFVLDRAVEWNIDPAKIIANGSSAGAVTVLQAEYAICNNTYNASQKLPAGFNYAGIISFAGAIFIDQGNLVWGKKPCPIQLFHGDADIQVPYDRLVYGPMGFYGAKSVTESLKALDYPYFFYKFEDYGHEIASDPMQENKEDVLWFLQTLVRDQKPYQIYKNQKVIGRPAEKKDFTFQDYVQGNFAR